MSVIVFVNAAVMLLFAAFMGLDALVFPATQRNFFEAFLLTTALGLFMGLAAGRPAAHLSRHQTFLLTVSVWLTGGLVGALPLFLWGLTPIDAVFESISGLTTTGSTVMSGLDTTPEGVLMWRALLQGFGGIGFIVTGMALLPILRTGGMQLFRTESSDKGDKELANAAHVALATLFVYIGLIVLCALTYGLGGMSPFDAITHAMTTLSTGGYANYDASFGHFSSPFLQWAGALFMVAGGVPFAWYIRALYRGRFQSEQVAAFVKMLAVVITILAIWLIRVDGRGVEEAFRLSAFNVISIVTTTGYASEDFSQWGTFAVVGFFILTAVGGCTGSTAGGAKMMRWIILLRVVKTSIRNVYSPHGIFAIRYEGRPVSDDVLSGVISFFTFYFLTVAVLSVALSLSGLDLPTAISGTLTAVANVGPGVGKIIGPAGNFEPLGGLEKLILVFGMFVGRLEMLTVYVLFTLAFWRDF